MRSCASGDIPSRPWRCFVAARCRCTSLRSTASHWPNARGDIKGLSTFSSRQDKVYLQTLGGKYWYIYRQNIYRKEKQFHTLKAYDLPQELSLKFDQFFSQLFPFSFRQFVDSTFVSSIRVCVIWQARGEHFASDCPVKTGQATPPPLHSTFTFVGLITRHLLQSPSFSMRGLTRKMPWNWPRFTFENVTSYWVAAYIFLRNPHGITVKDCANREEDQGRFILAAWKYFNSNHEKCYFA